MAQLMKGKKDILQGSVDRKVTNYCFDGLIKLRLESEVVEVVLR